MLSEEIEGKILSMFSMGMSTRDIHKHIEDMYGMNIATGAVSAITDKLIPKLKAWQQRPLDSHYPIVWLDGPLPIIDALWLGGLTFSINRGIKIGGNVGKVLDKIETVIT